MKVYEFAITQNMKDYLPKGVRATKYRDTLENQIIYKVRLTALQYREMWNIGEQIGGWILKFQPKNSVYIGGRRK